MGRRNIEDDVGGSFQKPVYSFDDSHRFLYICHMLLEAQNYQTYIRSVFLKKCQENPKYSLREFAKHLIISHSTLSQILNNKRRLSLTKAEHIAQRLNFDTDTKLHFLLLVEKNWADKGQSLKINERITALRIQNSQKHFVPADVNTVLNLSSLFVFELIGLEGFIASVENISDYVGLDSVQTQKILDNLCSAGWLLYSNGLYIKNPNFFFANIKTNIKDETLHAYFKEVLQKILWSIDSLDVPERTIRTKIKSYSRKNNYLIVKKIDTFMREIEAFIETSPNDRDSVALLNIQLLDLVKALPR